ncbi:MAG: 30S ribosomal protein S24e [Candidatus Micrarchaeia archaeon]
MEVQILSDRQNAYFDRREVEFSIIFEGPTAQKGEVLKELCKKLNINPDYAIIVGMSQSFGVKQSTGALHAYKSKEDMLKHEPRYLFDRGKKVKKQEEAAEPQKAAEAK